VSHLPKWSAFCIYLFQGRYRNWAKRNKYESKLPGDVKKRKAAAEVATRTLDRDLTEKKVAERVVPYSDRAFRQAMIEWLVATDQVRVGFLSRITLLSNLVLSM
jgi:hypothetical protein